MRTLGFRTHVLLALAGAVALVFSLQRPWYAAAPAPAESAPGIEDLNGPLTRLYEGLQRWVGEPTGTSGWEALDYVGIALAAMAGVGALGALGCLVAPLQSLGRDMLRYAGLAAFAIACWKLLDPPGDNATMELRYGALAGAVAALVLLTCGSGAAAAPLRRRRPAPKRYEAPPPPAYGTSRSTAPPGS
jgi:hypothetical protein